MVNPKYYIKLTCFKKKTGVAGNSWTISFDASQNCFILVCIKRFGNDTKIIKMKNVENFIRIWNHDMYREIKNLPVNEYAFKAQPEAYIELFVEKDYYSKHIISTSSSVPVDVIHYYIHLLKDMIEEKAKNDEVGEKINDRNYRY